MPEVTIVETPVQIEPDATSMGPYGPPPSKEDSAYFQTSLNDPKGKKDGPGGKEGRDDDYEQTEAEKTLGVKNKDGKYSQEDLELLAYIKENYADEELGETFKGKTVEEYLSKGKAVDEILSDPELLDTFTTLIELKTGTRIETTPVEPSAPEVVMPEADTAQYDAADAAPKEEPVINPALTGITQVLSERVKDFIENLHKPPALAVPSVLDLYKGNDGAPRLTKFKEAAQRLKEKFEDNIDIYGKSDSAKDTATDSRTRLGETSTGTRFEYRIVQIDRPNHGDEQPLQTQTDAALSTQEDTIEDYIQGSGLPKKLAAELIDLVSSDEQIWALIKDIGIDNFLDQIASNSEVDVKALIDDLKLLSSLSEDEKQETQQTAKLISAGDVLTKAQFDQVYDSFRGDIRIWLMALTRISTSVATAVLNIGKSMGDILSKASHLAINAAQKSAGLLDNGINKIAELVDNGTDKNEARREYNLSQTEAAEYYNHFSDDGLFIETPTNPVTQVEAKGKDDKGKEKEKDKDKDKDKDMKMK